MITISGYYWSGEKECEDVRVEAGVREGLIELKVSGPDITDATVFLHEEDALRLGKQLKKAAKKAWTNGS